MIKERFFEPDLIRSLMILVVFMAHALPAVAQPGPWTTLWSALSPGMTMSLLGYLSGNLLGSRSVDGEFLIKRGLRIFIPLWSCMFLIMTIMMLQSSGDVLPSITHPHTLMHLLGLSAFGDMFGIVDQSAIGNGLWFITAIFGLYLFLPVLTSLLKHRNGHWHLAFILFFAGVCHVWIYESESLWNVVIGFSLGVYYRIHQQSVYWHDPGRSLRSGWQKVCGVFAVVSLFAAVYIITTGYVGIGKGARDWFFPFYPILCVPVLRWVATWPLWTPVLQRWVGLFSLISFEFYLVHFYFINGHWGLGLSYPGVAAGFVLSIVLATVMYQCNCWASARAESYFFKKN